MKGFFLGVIMMISLPALCQESSIRISFPRNWVKFGKENVMQTVNERLRIPDSVKAAIRENSSSSVNLYGYAAPMKKSAAYRPNIQVILRKNTAADTTQLLQEVELNMIYFQTQFKEFSVIARPHVVFIGGRYSIETRFSATLVRENGRKAPFFSRIIIIPDGDVFYQVSMNDTAEYDCTEVFEAMISSVELVEED